MRIYSSVLFALFLASCGSGGEESTSSSSGTADPQNASSSGTSGTTSTSTIDSTSTSDPSSSSSNNTSGGPGQSWTVLVYMVADTNLEPYALQDLAEMAQVGSTDALNIVALVDRADDYSSEGLLNLGDWTSARKVRVNQGSLEQLSDEGELNMGEPSVLAAFIQWGITTYPADRVALVFWDHGASWPGFGGDESTANHDMLNLQELKQGMSQGLAAVGRGKFDLVGFDACLMATFEVAASLAPHAHYLLASEELEPGHGWDWRSLGILRDDPTSTAPALAARIGEGFRAQANAEQTENTITLAAIDLGQIDGVRAAVEALANALNGSLASSAQTIGRAQGAALAFGVMPDPAQSLNMIDLGDFVARLATEDASFGAVRTQVQSALSAAVLSKVTGPLTTAATGLSIYFPSQSAYYEQSYGTVEAAATWRGFLQGFLGAGASAAAPSFTNADHVAVSGVDGDGDLVVQGSLSQGSAASIASSTLSYGIVDTQNQRIFLLGQRPAAYNDSVVEGYWNMVALTVVQGSVNAYAYAQLDVGQDGLFSITIPFGYVKPGATTADYVVLVYVIDGMGAVQQATYYLVTDAGVGELQPEAGASLYPLIIEIDGNGNAQWNYSSNTPIDPSTEFSFNNYALPSGTTLYALLQVANFAGAGDYVYMLGMR